MYTRRHLLKHAGLASLLSSFRPFSGIVGNAQTTVSGDYKAIVCVYLIGGNDSNNVLVPTDSAGYANYARARGILAIPQGQLLPLNGVPFAVHPMMPEMQSMFNAGQLAFVANVGTLVTPLTKQQYLSSSVTVPENLMSHPDQVTISETAAATSNITVGWGGGMIDAIVAMNSQSTLSNAISYYGATPFINGASSSGLIAPGGSGFLACSEGTACGAIQDAVKDMMACPESMARIQAEEALLSQLIAMDATYANAIKEANPFTTAPPGSSGLYAAFTGIAQLMQVRSTVGAQRQVFFAGIGPFDTHANQNNYQGSLLATLSGSLQYFLSLLKEMGLSNSVTVFTLSDFNRTLQVNSSLGSDHGWGGHQIVLGGAVKGGAIYGTFPNLELGGPDDFTMQGRWVPTTSVSQLGATLASWFGVPNNTLSTIFPGLGNFTNSTLPFL